ncbi:MAG: hypothetical protein JWM16_1220 [Verrucomicrobiales bacterium]|nr:hypothetical protein [Verrucomicrobiales bacterium]
MPEPHAAVCPQCKREVIFLEVGDKRRCPECGFEFELSPPVLPVVPEKVAWTLGKKLLVAAAIVLGVIAVAFGGCLLVLRNMKF